MAPPVPSPIDLRAQAVVLELGFEIGGEIETRIARLIRDTILTEHERCAKAVEAAPVCTDMSAGVNSGARRAVKIAAMAIRNLPLASS